MIATAVQYGNHAGSVVPKIMDDLSFTTFLKIALLPSTQGKIGQIQRMHGGSGGYDFYKRMKLAAREVARGETSANEILQQLENIKRPAERIHNLAMATQFVEWWNLQEGATALAERPAGVYKLPHMAFGVRVSPELAYAKDGIVYVTYLWATRLPKLTRQVAAAGLLMLRQELAKKAFENARFQILDLRQKKVLGEQLITNHSTSLLQADIAQLSAIWSDITPKAA
jgi:hypothetical protein